MSQPAIPTPDEIWSILREVSTSQAELSTRQVELSTSQKETGEQIKTLSEEADKRLKTLSEEADKRLKALSREMAAINRETDRHIQKIGGRFNQRWGALVESLVEGKLVNVLRSFGIDVTQTHTRSVAHWTKPDGSVQEREFDIIAANGTEVVEVEVKTSLSLKDVNSFLEKIRDFKNYFPRYRTETVYGAVAYLNSEDEAHSYAEKQGLFIIQATGDSARLMNREGFKPKPFA